MEPLNPCGLSNPTPGRKYLVSIMRLWNIYSIRSGEVKYSLIDSFVNNGPITKDGKSITKYRPGNILNVLDITKCNNDRFLIKLLVTSSPLMKKNTFTARPPVVTYVNKSFVGSVIFHDGLIANEW